MDLVVGAHGKAGTTGSQAVLGASLFSPQKSSSGAVNNKQMRARQSSKNLEPKMLGKLI